ncbi:hypothetical protein HRbin33_00195 [bacterium HR33]|nr:hypothetical protein HRbin33_00195 [bacterium HR33]
MATLTTTIGPIVRLQVQRSPLKLGEGAEKRYHTGPITAVERLILTRDGAVGLSGDSEILDVHHRTHPAGKNDDGKHGVSLGFTSHYREMQRRFGGHVTLGCAGENLIVEAESRIDPETAARGFALLDRAGRPKGYLKDVSITHPCRPFARFAHGGAEISPEQLKEALAFLDGGTRGFYCTFYADAEPVVVEPGDILALLEG